MRILHIADVHLDRPFVGLSRDAARQRRLDLVDAFRRCLAAASERRVDLVTIGGDLWEDENVTADTRASVAHELGLLDMPVLAICGNHDPYLRGGAYQRTAWPANVTIIDSADLVEVPVDPRLSVWAASWTERPLDVDFLAGFTVPDDGRTHVLLIHGTTHDSRFAQASTYCPFDPAAARQAGFRQVLAGHIHAGSCLDDVVYPGSPEPLDHSEIGQHCYALVEVEGDRVETELIAVNQRRYVAVVVDCADAASSAEVEMRVRDAIPSPADRNAIVTVLLRGETAPECAIDRASLAARLERDYLAATVKDETEPAVNYVELSHHHSADGLFVASMLERIQQASDARQRRILELAMQAGVRAMQGHKDLLRVG